MVTPRKFSRGRFIPNHLTLDCYPSLGLGPRMECQPKKASYESYSYRPDLALADGLSRRASIFNNDGWLYRIV